MLNNPKTSSIQRKKPIPDADRLLKKELFSVYNCFSAFAKGLEQMQSTGPKKPKPVMRRIVKTAGKEVHLEEVHLDRAVASCETWTERDKVCRRLAKFCFDLAKYFLRVKDYKNAQKWMTLTHRYLRLSVNMKDQLTDEQLDELEDMLKEVKKRQEEAKGP
jgi:hypothetical protein